MLLGDVNMKAYIFLADGFEELEVVYPISLLREAQIETLSVSINGSKSVSSSHGVTIFADVLFEDVDLFDAEIIILPGGQPGTDNLSKYSPLEKVIRYYYDKKYIAAICAAPSILGKMGLLENRKAICYPGYEGEMKGAQVMDSKVVVDGNVITAIGPGVAKDFAYEIIKHIASEDDFRRVCQSFGDI